MSRVVNGVVSRPVIGVPTQTLEPIPNELPLCWIMNQQYVRVLAAAGAVPWLIPLLEDDVGTLRSIYDRLDGLFLTGGVDVDPASYGEARGEACGRTDAPRDWTELTLTRWAMADRMPVLAVCRGAQVINVAAGGTLFQHVGTERPATRKHDYWPLEDGPTRDLLVHDVRVEPATRLARILDTATLRVNSMHHQGIRRLAPGLVASAFAEDGLIEGIESANDHFLIGVQWHPEYLVDRHARMRRLFEAFLEASAGHRTPGVAGAGR